MRVAVISDIHHGKPSEFRGQWRKLSDHALPLLREVVVCVNDEVRPDWVLHLGDAIQDVDAARDRVLYAEAMAVLKGLSAPLLHVTGNHDEACLPEAELETMRGPDVLQAPLEAGGFTILRLPSHNTLERCWVEDADVELLKGQLAAGTGPVLLVMHHSLSDEDVTGNPWFEDFPQQSLIEGRAAIRQVLRASGRVRAVINGHLHWNRLWVEGDVPFFTVHSLVENIAPPGTEPLPAAAWSILEVAESGLSLTVRGNAPAQWSWQWPAPCARVAWP